MTGQHTAVLVAVIRVRGDPAVATIPQFSEQMKKALFAAKKAAIAIGRDREKGETQNIPVEAWELLNGLFQVAPDAVNESLTPLLSSRRMSLRDLPWVDLKNVPDSVIEGKQFRVITPAGENYIQRARKMAGKEALKPEHLLEVILAEPDGSLKNILREEPYYRRMDSFLKKRIIGQDVCIEALIQGLKVSRLRLNADKPFSFALLGPTGVGKTEMVKQAARFLFGEKEEKSRFLCLNLSRYQMETAHELIFGGSPWKGQPGEGLLFPFFKSISKKIPGSSIDYRVEAPCVILLDEIEKAHYSLFAALLGLLDTGLAEVIHEQQHFRFQLASNSLVFMASNAGATLYNDPSIGSRFLQDQELIKEALQKEGGWEPEETTGTQPAGRYGPGGGFRPEFLSRVDRYILFSRLQPSHMEQIAQLNLAALEERVIGQNLFPQLRSVSFDPALKTLLAFKDGFQYGVRNLKTLIENTFVPPLITYLDEIDPAGVEEIQVILADPPFKSRMCQDEGKIRVLAVDDPEDLRDPSDYRNHFSDMGMEWDSAATVGEALNLLKENDYLFVLMDLLEDVLAQIRRRYPHVPVFIFSDETPLEQVNRVLRAGGARDFLRKDLDEAEIQRQLSVFRQLALDQQRTRLMKEYLSGQSNGFSFELAPARKEGNTLVLEVRNVQPVYTPRTDDLALYTQTLADVRLVDVQGIEAIRPQVEELIAILKTPREALALGARLPRGVLLHGPPGTGKTMLAMAMASESGLPFLHTSSATLQGRYARFGSQAMTAFFNQARRNAPCMVFIDEIDGIGGVRTGLQDSQLLHALLTGIDSIQRHELILFVAATNRPEVLDPALVRPGRFDRKLHMGPPCKEGRKAILRRILKDYDVASLDEERLAVLTAGFTGAMLVNLMNESALAARRKARKVIDQEMIEETLDLVRYGPETEMVMDQEARRQVAVHELGHGLLTLEFGLETLHKVSMISRSDFLGMSRVLPDERPAGRHRGYWLRKIAVCLGGRVAESLIYGEEQGQLPGVESDFERATEMTTAMVCQWGMSPALRGGLVTSTVDHLGQTSLERHFFSDETARTIDQSVQEILKQAEALALQGLEKWKGHIPQWADLLVEEEELSGDRLKGLMRQAAV